MLFETLLATKWHKMRGWFWKADREERKVYREGKGTDWGVQMEANDGEC